MLRANNKRLISNKSLGKEKKTGYRGRPKKQKTKERLITFFFKERRKKKEKKKARNNAVTFSPYSAIKGRREVSLTTTYSSVLGLDPFWYPAPATCCSGLHLKTGGE